MKRYIQLAMIVSIIISGPLFVPRLAAVLAQTDRAPTPDDLPVKIFMPWVNQTGAISISGVVTGPDGQPLGGVKIVDQHGYSATSNPDGSYSLKGLDSGNYILVPEKDGLLFNPTMTEVKLESSNVTQNFKAVATYNDVINNGSFETDAAWQMPESAPAEYTYAAAHSGRRSVLSGILDADKNINGYSIASQTVQVPSNIVNANLRVWLYPLSGETLSSGANLAGLQPLQASAAYADLEAGTLAGDVQYVQLLDTEGNLLENLLWMRSDAQQWQVYDFNVTKYAGRTLNVQVATYNDGQNGVSAMYVDDVALETVLQPPTPTCANYFINPDFETYTGWEIPVTRYPARYSMALAHTGVQSIRTGITNPDVNVYSYSDAFQEVTIPSDATYAKVGAYLYHLSDEASATSLQDASQDAALEAELQAQVGELWGQEALSGDVQYIMVVSEYGYLLEILRSWTKNTEAWNYFEYDLLDYKGQTIRIQFGTYNDGYGGQTAMYADDFLLDICSTAPTPTPPPPTPTPPPPGVGTELFANNSFEADSDWGIPITRYTAGYSTDQAYTGTRSMRNGITLAGHNRYSYSDAYQSAYVPSSATSVTLSMYVYQLTTESTPLALADMPTAALSPEATNAGDVQYVLLLDWYGNWIDTLLWKRKNTTAWNNHVFDLSDYRGRYVRVQFGVYNDGYGGYTSMYVDDVSLQYVQ